jgi:hypothetical protein
VQCVGHDWWNDMLTSLIWVLVSAIEVVNSIEYRVSDGIVRMLLMFSSALGMYRMAFFTRYQILVDSAFWIPDIYHMQNSQKKLMRYFILWVC